MDFEKRARAFAMRVFCGPPRLFLTFSQYPSGFWIDEMYPCTGRADHGLNSMVIALGWILGQPALHVQPGMGATKHE